MSDGDAEDHISYEDWGVAFFTEAASEQRILGAVDSLAGQPIEVGPLGVGPGRLAQVSATGRIGLASAVPEPGEWVSYRVTLPVELDFTVDLTVDTHRYHARLEVPLVLTARAAAPLKIVIDVTPPARSEVRVTLKSDGLRASMLNRMVGIEGELQRFVASYVTREIDKPAIAKARVIDVQAAIDGAWRSMRPKEPTVAREVAADLETAIVEEIREHEGAFVETRAPREGS